MLHLIDVVLHPFLTFRFDLLKGIKLDLVLWRVDELFLDIVLFSKAIEPKSTPNISHVANHREGASITQKNTCIAFGSGSENDVSAI